MNSLVLIKAKRKIVKNQTPREYLDFIVSGQSLRTILGIESDDLITAFGWEIDNENDRHIRTVFRLKEKSELKHGRIMAIVCA